MTLASFTRLNFEDQIAAVWEHGRYIATRYEEEDVVGLYNLDTFFVELYYNQDENHLVQHTRTFTMDDSDSLHDYAI